jgi:uncharacterized membrane protein
MYNSLIKFVRGIIRKMRRLNRDVLLIALSLIIGALCGFIPTATNFINLKAPLWLNILSAIVYIIVIAFLSFFMVQILNNIHKIDKKDEEEDVENKAKLDAIVGKLGITKNEIELLKPKSNEKKR